MDISKVKQRYEVAREQYRELGVDTDNVLRELGKVSLSVHCWQGDDVGGFETPDASLSGGGIQVTGNYPGKARTIQELQQDLEKVYSLLPGTHRLNLHAIYGDFMGKKVDRDEVGPEHFETWVNWAKKLGIGLDFNCTPFSHPMADEGYSLASKNKKIRNFWIRHVQRCREITEYMGKELGSYSIHNIWIADGAKDHTVDRFGHRKVLKEALDEIFEREFNDTYIKDTVESKLFGIGSESFVVGSHDFYLSYALTRGKMLCVDMGHYHPTESVADKISSIMQFMDEMMLHVSRGVRWDSDHVVVLDDDVKELSEEIVRSGYLHNIRIGLDFFDGTLNRVGAYTVGARATLKSLLLAMLEPYDQLKEYEEKGDFFARLALLEQMKSMPFGAIWDYYCSEQGVLSDNEIIEEVHTYENEVTSKRK